VLWNDAAGISFAGSAPVRSQQPLQVGDTRLIQRLRDAGNETVAQRGEHAILVGAHQRPQRLPVRRLSGELVLGLAQRRGEALQQLFMLDGPGFREQIAEHRQVRIKLQ